MLTLEKLNPVKREASGHPECLASTRVDIRCELIDWAMNISASPNVRWMHGPAGAGKSTISSTIASYLRDLHRLGAFVFFDRSFANESLPSRVIQTIAYKLGEFDPRIGHAICSAIRDFPFFKDASLGVQFTELLAKSLATVEDLQHEGVIVIVLDALDECGTAQQRAQLLQVLGSQLCGLPPMFRVLITSRPSEDIVVAFERQGTIVDHPLVVSLKASQDDILAFFTYELGKIQMKKKWQTWPGSDTIQTLVTQSCGLFVWASTTVRFLDSSNPKKTIVQVTLQPRIISG